MNNNRLLIQRAGEAVKAGEKRQARALLLQAVRQDAQDYRAWLGLARIAPSPQASLDYAQRASRLKPNAPIVQKVLAWAEKRVIDGEQLTVNNPQSTITSPQPIVYRWSTAVTWSAAAFIILLLLGIGGLAVGNSRGLHETAVNLVEPSAQVIAQVERSLPEQDAAAAMTATAVPTPTPTPSATAPAIQPKHIAEGKEDGPRATWTITPMPTDTPTPSPTPLPTFVSPNNSQPTGRPFGVGQSEHWIDINLSSQTLTAYEGDTAVYNTLISSGLPSFPTVTGQFRVWLRFESQTMDGTRLGYDYYLENVPYVMYFYEDYALHGTFWHNNFGQPMSHGCVNMYTPDAQWLFNWSTIGTVVNVHY